MGTWRRYLVAGVLTGLALLAVGEIVGSSSDDLPNDHGLESLVAWRPSDSALFECLIAEISADPSRFRIADSYQLVPPENGGSVIGIRSAGSARELRLAERAVEIRVFTDFSPVPIDCEGETGENGK